MAPAWWNNGQRHFNQVTNFAVIFFRRVISMSVAH
jgi:hypothetical protein